VRCEGGVRVRVRVRVRVNHSPNVTWGIKEKEVGNSNKNFVLFSLFESLWLSLV
jgi:hypothetical protein